LYHTKQATQNPEPGEPPLLDLFSTSQTKQKCVNNAPYICIPKDTGAAALYQGCCNSWYCPRCSEKRARFEYGRMVVGARELAERSKLYMMTITCKGKETVEESEKHYLERTNRLHSNIRIKAKRDKMAKVEYAAVLERQGRGHPHTHYMTTFCPNDAYFIVDHYERYCADVQRINKEIPEDMRYSPVEIEKIDHRQLFSYWLALACVSAGLGVQVRLAIADLVEGASRYIAKYLFKDAQITEWPKGWKRIRYSSGWPKMPVIQATSAFPVFSSADWYKVASIENGVECWGKEVFERAVRHLVINAFYKDSEGNQIGVGAL
jgi:hypothetical protein